VCLIFEFAEGPVYFFTPPLEVLVTSGFSVATNNKRHNHYTIMKIPVLFVKREGKAIPANRPWRPIGL
jgi:hypothetical protein